MLRHESTEGVSIHCLLSFYAKVKGLSFKSAQADRLQSAMTTEP